MIYPKFLKENNTIGVPAPSAGAGVLEKQRKLENAIQYLEKQKYHVVHNESLFSCEKGRSASALDRANEINDMFNRQDIDFILCATGGDFLIEILPYVDFNLLKKNPKYVSGFSDPTGLLYPITTKHDIATIYGQNLSPFGSEVVHKSQSDFLNLAQGKTFDFSNYDLYESEYPEKVTGLEGYNLTEKVEWKTLDKNDVKVTGRIIGGCMDIIAELSGTKYDGINEFNDRYKNDGIIWYFDNCELSMEETIRVLWKFNELDYFKYAKAIIFGRFGSQNTYYDYDVKSCILDSVISKLDIPIIYDADFSHKAPCLPVINGSLATVEVSNFKGIIKYELK
ncbi:MAG: LD-carboxypeptidase [Bacilli bacterium]|nr:LD-carboxypeptidase [Bacilli bacterium]